MSFSTFASSHPVKRDGDFVHIEASGPHKPVLTAFARQLNQLLQNEALWENVDQNKVFTTMAKVILELREGDIDAVESTEDSDISGEEMDEEVIDYDDDDEEEETADRNNPNSQVNNGDDEEMVDPNDPNAPVCITLQISNDFTANDLEHLRVFVSPPLPALSLRSIARASAASEF